MVKNPSNMKSTSLPRQQEPACGRRFALKKTGAALLLMLAGLSAMENFCQAQETNTAGSCRFALALPEMEGPLTLGIFSTQGELVRLLYFDASITSIPAGINGLLISWDGKNDDGSEVPDGTYRARGLVHGPLAISLFPQRDEVYQYAALRWTNDERLLNFPPLFSPNHIVVRAAQDALLEKRPLLAVTAKNQEGQVMVDVEGLPIFSISVAGRSAPRIELRHGSREGMAELTLLFPEGRESYTITGLDHLVPLDAGTLQMPSDKFLPQQ